MGKEKFSVGKAPLITVVDCAGDLVVRPWLNLDVQAKGDYQTEVDGETVTFESSGDLILSVPEGSNLVVKRAAGDVVVRSIAGSVELLDVRGDVVLGNLATVKLGHIHGDLVANSLSGSLTAEQIDGDVVLRNLDADLTLGIVNGDGALQFVNGTISLGEMAGDLSVRSVSGDVEIGKVRRDANLRNLSGSCSLSHVSGDIRLLGGLGPFEHSLYAEGDIVVRWPIDAPLLLEAEASRIVNQLPLRDVAATDQTLSGRLGDGNTRLNLKADGTIILKEAQIVAQEWTFGTEPVIDFDFMAELSSLGAKISSEVGEQVARVTAELESNFGPDFMQRMAEQFAQKATDAAAKARKTAAASEHGAGRTTTTGSKGSADERAEKSSQRDGKAEAQLKILKMVEKGVISPDEASTLLEALEGD